MAIEAIKTKKELSEAVYGFRASRIILTAFELGLFSKLGENSLNAAQLAAASATEPRACERLLNALCVLGLLKKAGGRFRNTKISRDHLLAGKPQFMAGLTHSASQWQTWHTLSDAVRRGTSVIKRQANRKDEKRRRGFIAAMHERASAQAPRIVRLLDLAAVNRCLDIGAGSGAYAMALAQAKKSLRVVAFDLPEVLPLTREYVRRERLLPRIDFVPGDFNRGGFGSGYDLIMLSAIVHMNDAQQNRRLIARAAAALNRGGQLVVQDFIMGPDRTRPGLGALFALNMLVATAHGDSYTAAEIGGWMRAAGLKKIKKKDTPFDAALLIGWKE
ncbi:MAG: acetylserotonin O-methyltransferase [Candidatus Aminicenantes bacterium]|jgi:SAM-dependent methyltransferase|nr:acetylserotonin O-methyltransferase [Candidatus Aminicenantes bacterium]